MSAAFFVLLLAATVSCVDQYERILRLAVRHTLGIAAAVLVLFAALIVSLFMTDTAERLHWINEDPSLWFDCTLSKTFWGWGDHDSVVGDDSLGCVSAILCSRHSLVCLLE